MLDFLKLRPATNTSADIAEALERARTAAAETAPRIEAARKRRDDLLLDGDDKAITAAEKALADAREDVERTHSVVSRLEERYATAVRAERIGRADTAAKVAEAADTELQRWWSKNEAGLRRILAEGHRLSVAMTDAAMTAQMQARLALGEYPDAELGHGAVGYGEHREWPKAIAALIEHGVQLPRAAAPATPAEETTDTTGPTGPGGLAMGIQSVAGSGSQIMTYGGAAVG
ncbi:hypothetical protein [Roseomonas indoligenes]|uniref:Uncharacterized protein n=1 Tax=Roseomonas indoligenes TaxID=2820811 RepID=A0A940N2G9_9PROT|nr:hypothetical protein [Pararoseomonas indoligenes]MBP0493985.1 hypothetical protein [Pararoseomonas indoligenes]